MSSSDFIIACAKAHRARVAARGVLASPHGKAKRNHPKRHGVGKRLAINKAKAIAKGKAAMAAQSAKRSVALEQARAYWAGIGDHP